LTKRHYITENEIYNESVEKLNIRPEKVTGITFRIKENKNGSRNRKRE
jgi:hypothetical protein